MIRSLELKKSFFDKINDVAIVDTFKKVFQRQNGEVLQSSVLQVGTVD